MSGIEYIGVGFGYVLCKQNIILFVLFETEHSCVFSVRKRKSGQIQSSRLEIVCPSSVV